MKSIRTQIYLPEWLKAEVQKAAKDKKVSMADFIRDVLKKEIESAKGKRS